MNPVFLLSIILGPVYILIGFILRKFPPSSPNLWYGYRTAKAFKNEENWKFAQQYSGRQLMIWGAVYMALSPIGLFISINPIADLVAALCLLIIFSLLPVIYTERALSHFETKP